MELSTKYAAVVKLIDQANAGDPTLIDYKGERQPKELLYASRHLAWVLNLQPDASELLCIAAQTQHICRWESPRSDYPMNRAGYLKWREDLKRFHAQRAGELMAEVGYSADAIERVQSLNLKKQLKADPECQTLEDALCLAFLELGFDDLIAKYEDEKILSIVQKTAAKMSEAGRAQISTIPFSEAGQRILAML
ncbi:MULTISPECIES: DUF4202 domain-containing protein [unclassified Lentimonas]|uniref:DUF4202 domain-containing protein n=1 Tax=unclassified Lentimonas TaxID=2630993 RepID=UPI001322BC0D|nr:MULTISPECIES: DUF4202 domain-containing protein [unclassified Lentimonas]CAA6678532.1 Unannotated [Lentimonas sp. CC4]CAA6685764.1 Unannotated [Lentimonas sp. CC6]CAA6695079.1 Unannotated [Lentimonas sp. CC19]CAA6697195.1 Unannotated [Lentimonas sp. CC10]CAA7069847.1 Unannotated [Lentimonas sp. CC11]